jgi:hypothetical protein
MTTATRHASTDAALSDAWMADGLCRQVDADMFFPEGRGAAITTQIEQAKKICAGCPSKQACLEWALQTGQHSGVWGGTSEEERRGMRQAPDGDQLLLCIAEQEFIERRLTEGGTHREVAAELGVGHHAVGRALRVFEAERVLVQDGQVKAA